MAQKTSPNDVFNKILKEITEGTLRPGTRLIERQLSERFKVSRTPVREALFKLEQMQIIDFTEYKGSRVRHLSKKEADDLFEVRMLLDGFSAKTCTLKAMDSDLKNIANALEKFSEVVNDDSYDFDDSESMDKYIKNVFKANNRFHNQIVKGSHNKWLIEINLSYNVQISLIRHISLPQRTQKSLEEHIEIFEAINNRNPELASEKAAEHIRKTWEFACQYY